MKKRYLYALLFTVPGFLISLPVSLNIFFVFLDLYDTYGRSANEYSESELFSILVLIFFVTWIALIVVAYLIGRRLEKGPVLNWVPIVIVGFTVLLFAFLWQWGVNYMKEQSNSKLCGEYCQSRGYHVSIASPSDAPEQTCYCSNGPDSKRLIVPLEDLK